MNSNAAEEAKENRAKKSLEVMRRYGGKIEREERSYAILSSCELNLSPFEDVKL